MVVEKPIKLQKIQHKIIQTEEKSKTTKQQIIEDLRLLY